MYQDSDSKTKFLQTPFPITTSETISHQITPHLKLVVSNPPRITEKPCNQTNLNTRFTAEIQKRGHSHYVLVACDPSYCLDFEISLEIHENEEEFEPMCVVCHFPNILSEGLNELVDEDEMLYGMILIQFQMKMLEQLLLFCSNHNTLNLIIDIEEDTPESYALKIYRHITKYEDKIPTTTGTKTQMVIPITPKTFDLWLKLTNQVNRDFRRTLWKGQSDNPTMRAYIKSDPCLKSFS